MAIIKSSESSDILTIDATSNAGRIISYDKFSSAISKKNTFRAATTATFLAPTSTGTFFTFFGSSTKLIKILRIWYQATINVASSWQNIAVTKYISTPTGGTSSTLTITSLDSNNAAGTATNIKTYTVAPTNGTSAGIIEVVTLNINLNATGVDTTDIIFDFRDYSNLCLQPIFLRNINEGIGLSSAGGFGNTVNTTLAIEWTEE